MNLPTVNDFSLKPYQLPSLCFLWLLPSGVIFIFLNQSLHSLPPILDAGNKVYFDSVVLYFSVTRDCANTRMHKHMHATAGFPEKTPRICHVVVLYANSSAHSLNG